MLWARPSRGQQRVGTRSSSVIGVMIDIDDPPSLCTASPHIPACNIPTCSVYAANQGDNLPYKDDSIEEQGILGLKVGLKIHNSSPVGFFL